MDPDRPVTLTLSHRAGADVVELPAARIDARSPDGTETSARLPLHPLVVGTAPDCDLVLADPSVSRRHCQISLGPESLLIRDLGSKNGTRIGGLRILEAELPVGTVARIGSSELRAHLLGETTVIPLSPRTSFGQAVGTGVAMRSVFAQLERAASSAEPLLLLGESGTGKEILARAVHEAGPRHQEPFVVCDCASLAPALAESELFGVVKGAYTGASSDRAGLFEHAGGGTLFLDEVGDLPVEVQPKLLRAIAGGEIRRVGDAAPRKVDVRVIAAAHAGPEAKVTAGGLRDPLFYRLAVLSVRVPPLRERLEDIPRLAERFLAAHHPPRSLADLPPHVMELLSRHLWPGNVRELRNVVARLALFPELGPAALETILPRHPDAPAELVARVLQLPWSEARERVLDEFERQYLRARLREHGGNVSAAARAMGISRQLTHRLLARAGLKGGDD